MTLSSIPPNLSYDLLVTWWSDYSRIHSTISVSATRELCSLLETTKSKNEITCGFEFHHYSLTRKPDFLVFSDTSTLSRFDHIILPDWCSSFESFVNGQASKGIGVVPENWLEFDFVGSNLVLAGLWQRLFQINSDDHKCINLSEWDFFCALLCSSFFDHTALSHPILKSTISYLSLPHQLGIMHARRNKLKLVYQCHTEESLNQLDSLLAYLGELTCSDIFDITQYLRNNLSLFSVAVSLDIDLQMCSLSQQHIAFEIMPVDKHRSQSQISILHSLINLFHVHPSEVDQLYQVLDLLPYGQVYQFPSHATHSSLRNVAKLNHLKFIYISGEWHIKSYIKLVQQIF